MTGFSDGNQVRFHLTISSGEGVSEMVTVNSGTTVLDVFNSRVGGNPKSYVIRVNGSRDPLSTYVLQEGDRLSFTPEKIMVAH
jgi:sulfur carrier protein ThiS